MLMTTGSVAATETLTDVEEVLAELLQQQQQLEQQQLEQLVDLGADDNSSDFAGAYGGADDYTPHERLLRLLWLSVGYPVLVLGTIGHVLAAALLLSRQRLRVLPVAPFLIVMSAAGQLALLVGLLSNLVEQQTYSKVLLSSSTSEIGCRLHMAAVYFALQLYSSMEACVAVERLLAVRWPHRYRRICTPRRATTVATVIAAALLSLNAVGPFRAYGYTADGFCALVDVPLFADAWRYAHWVVYAALPIAIMVPCNALTLRALRGRWCTRSDGRSQLRRCWRNARSTTVAMLSLNAAFVATTVPVMAGDWRELSSRYEGLSPALLRTAEDDVVDVAWCISRLLMYAGCSAAFPVYLVAGRRFRKELCLAAGSCFRSLRQLRT